MGREVVGGAYPLWLPARHFVESIALGEARKAFLVQHAVFGLGGQAGQVGEGGVDEGNATEAIGEGLALGISRPRLGLG
jgi:hypothetical protein